MRKVKSGEAGPYFQLVESFRTPDAKTPRTRVLVHLGAHPTKEAALSAWPEDIRRLRAIGRDRQADRLSRNLEKLRTLTETERKDR